MRFFSRRNCLISLLVGVPLALFLLSWRAASWRPRIRQVALSPILALQWTPNGKTIRCATGAGEVKTIAAPSLATLSSRGKGDGWTQAQFSNNGLLFVIYENEVRLIESKGGYIIWKRDVTFSSPTQSAQGQNTVTLTISPRGDSLAYSTSWLESGTAFTLRVRAGRVFAEPKGEITQNGRFYSELTETMALSADGTLAYEASGPGVSLVINGKSISLPLPPVPIGMGASALAFSPDGRTLAANYDLNEIVLWNVATKSINHVLSVSLMDYHSPLVFSHDGKALAVASKGGVVNLWAVASGRMLREIRVGRSSISALDFSPDGSRLAVGTGKGEVQIWRLR